MKPIWFWTGYLLLLLSCSLLDVQIIALLAMPLFLLSAVLFTYYYAKLINEEKRGSGIAVFLSIFGSILISGFSAFGAVEYSVYYTSGPNGATNPILPLDDLEFAIIGAGLLLGSLLILLSLRRNKRFTGKRLLKYWIPTLIAFPLIMLLIVILESIGFPVGSG